MLSAKELKKLASACRAAGIKSYKTADFEFVLTDEPPVKETKRAKATQDESPVEFESDSLTTEQLLMWSSGEMEASDESDIQ